MCGVARGCGVGVCCRSIGGGAQPAVFLVVVAVACVGARSAVLQVVDVSVCVVVRSAVLVVL